jgi:hypothetical protein
MLTTGFRLPRIGLRPTLENSECCGFDRRALVSLNTECFCRANDKRLLLDFTVNRAAPLWTACRGRKSNRRNRYRGKRSAQPSKVERYPISVCYSRDFRDIIDALGGARTTATGTLPIADLRYRIGAPNIRNENGCSLSAMFP